MAVIDGKHFSRIFSLRTIANYTFIDDIVNLNDKKKAFHDSFLDNYDLVLTELDVLIKELRDTANISKEYAGKGPKGKSEIKSKIYGIANKLEQEKKVLKSRLDGLIETGEKLQSRKQYEVVQLLNSLMGMAVLPYEMHNKYFKKEASSDDTKTEESLNELQNRIKDDDYYKYLLDDIKKLYDEKKWRSTFRKDIKDNGNINEKYIVFSFLRHIRNTACHAGNNCISIYPSGDSDNIGYVLFHEVGQHDPSDEFAMKISIDELKKLIESIANFYNYTEIGEIDKTKEIESLNKRVEELLGQV